MKSKVLKTVLIALITIIVVFNLLIIFKAIHFTKDVALIIKLVSLGIIFALSLVYWSMQFGYSKLLKKHKTPRPDDNKNNN